ncbi:MAG: replication and repair protein RecF [Chloroflexota bacterium]|jgi:DNA replication and repair protein RecF|nr:replication and repair protein RecF [Chloroflexota bacterium]
MLVDRLTLTSFRSYAAIDATFPDGPQVIVGDNATGKTNLLESLVVLGTGRSHRAAADGELIAWGAEFCRLEASVADSGGTKTLLEVIVERTAGGAGAGSGSVSGSGGGRKRIQVNGVGRRATALAAALPVVLFAPEDMLLISGSPALRRASLDTLVAQTMPAAGATLSTYARAITQRNNLLRAIRENAAAPDELRFWDEVVIDEGARIVDWRRDILARLAEPLAAAHLEIAPAEERLELRYVTNAEPQVTETTRDALRRRLSETADKEQWNGATLIGPHRDDIVFASAARDLAGFASRGQQRTAILAFKLAQLDLLRGALGQAPLLLLDDVFSELDPSRRAHLVRRIGELPQAFVTTTTTDDLDPQLVAAATVWQVTPGRLARVGGSA